MGRRVRVKGRLCGGMKCTVVLRCLGAGRRGLGDRFGLGRAESRADMLALLGADRCSLNRARMLGMSVGLLTFCDLPDNIFYRCFTA